jgi:hypothetical protein
MPRRVHPHKVFHWPNESGEHNFVQLQIDYDEPGFRQYPMLAFPHNGDSHSAILKKFLEEMHIHQYVRIHSSIGLVPATKGNSFDVVGLGRDILMQIT